MFTKEDDNKLAHYIASRLPTKKEGGRLSINLYKNLVQMVFTVSYVTSIFALIYCVTGTSESGTLQVDIPTYPWVLETEVQKEKTLFWCHDSEHSEGKSS